MNTTKEWALDTLEDIQDKLARISMMVSGDLSNKIFQLSEMVSAVLNEEDELKLWKKVELDPKFSSPLKFKIKKRPKIQL